MPSTKNTKSTTGQQPNTNRPPIGAAQNTPDAQPSPTAMMQNDTGEYVQVPVREAAARWETRTARITTEYNRQNPENVPGDANRPTSTHGPEIPEPTAATPNPIRLQIIAIAEGQSEPTGTTETYVPEDQLINRTLEKT